MLLHTHRPSVAQSPHAARTFWAAAIFLLSMSMLLAWQYRTGDHDGLLFRTYLFHALIGSAVMSAFGLFYQTKGDHQPDAEFYQSAHFWLTFVGILAMMSNELLIPESVLGWSAESLESPGYFFLHIVSHGIVLPIGVLIFAIGQGMFVFRLGMTEQARPMDQAYHPDGKVAA